MTTQSIIVYRNPVEAAFWESGIIVPLGGSLLTGFIVFLVIMRLLERRIQRMNMRWANLATGTVAGVALVAAGFVFHWLSI